MIVNFSTKEQEFKPVELHLYFEKKAELESFMQAIDMTVSEIQNIFNNKDVNFKEADPIRAHKMLPLIWAEFHNLNK